MKRILSLALFGAVAAALGGCPIYPDNPRNRVCDNTGCYDCPTNSDCSPPYGGPIGCTPGSCSSGYTCGASNQCEPGDCSTTGCPSGYVCELTNASVQCVPSGTLPDAGTPPPRDASAPDTSIPDATPPDSGVACQTNANCTSGAICLDGVCVPPVDQCYDGTQCPAGDKCVQGACMPSCTVSADGGSSSCPTGYSCSDVSDASSAGVCIGNPTPCSKDPSVCPGGTVCSQDHCVAPCGTGGSCPATEECVQGGCVPNQNPRFICATDGVQDACASGSVCLHHSCYIACNPDAGASACQSADQFNLCKAVTTTSGTYNVCGSSSNLGTECSPTQACASSAAVCIDGYCH